MLQPRSLGCERCDRAAITWSWLQTADQVGLVVVLADAGVVGLLLRQLHDARGRHDDGHLLAAADVHAVVRELLEPLRVAQGADHLHRGLVFRLGVPELDERAQALEGGLGDRRVPEPAEQADVLVAPAGHLGAAVDDLQVAVVRPGRVEHDDRVHGTFP